MRPSRLPLLIVVPALLAGCGGGGSATPETTTAAGTAQPPPTETGGGSQATLPATPARQATFTVSLSGESHRATAGKPWRFVVHARTKGGRPVGGTAIIQVIVGDEVVDTLGWFAFTGTMQRSYRFSPQIRGRSGVVLSAKIIGPRGSKRATYAVRVV
jgi:hypothetical protein